MQDIANLIGCSLHKVKFWMERYEISRRSHSDAVYLSKHPNGDPFRFVPPKNVEEAKLFGLGIGLYWGEGTKANHTSIRLGNTDPLLIKKFIEFLVKFFRVKREDMRFGLQVFSDMDPDTAMDFWVKNLKIKRGQFWKTTVTRSGSIGTYRKKRQYGVVTVHYQNSRLRKLLGSLLPV